MQTIYEYVRGREIFALKGLGGAMESLINRMCEKLKLQSSTAAARVRVASRWAPIAMGTRTFQMHHPYPWPGTRSFRHTHPPVSAGTQVPGQHSKLFTDMKADMHTENSGEKIT